MWLPQICLFLVVTPLLVCAAPTASTAHSEEIKQQVVSAGPEDLTATAVDSLDSTVKRSARIDSFLAIPSTSFSCSSQAVPGIFADTETGCQVFHYCQADGRMDSFFCPNLTLFNQQYFVCDWEYNVDCSSAPQYFSLNEALYKSPEKIYQAINPAIKIVQKELLQGAASSEVSRTLNSLVSRLDSRTSAIVVDSSPSPSHNTGGQSFPSPQTLDSLPTGREGKSVDTATGAGAGVGADADAGAGAGADGGAGAGAGAGADGGAGAGAGAVYNALPTYAGTATNIVIPSVTASSVVIAEPTTTLVDTQYATADVADDAVADPEPAGYYNTDPVYNTINTGADQYAIATASDGYDDAVADPEPDCYYSGTCSPASGSYVATDTSYAAADDTTADDAIADPEPASYYSADASVDVSSSYVKTPGPSYPDAVYDPYNSPDPEPSAIPYSVGGSYGQYDSADPEPDSYYGYYDSSDPEPAAYYGANTIDLSSSVQDSYKPSQYSSSDSSTNQAGDYDDVVADPEPDPSSYGADINLYDSTGYQQPSYQAYSASSAINDYYKGYPSQGLVVDSPDPEPSSDPEFTPYGE